MNKRQAKKQFKKKYGVNPDRMSTILEKELPKVIEVIRERLPDIINEMCQTMKAAVEDLQEKLREMNSEEFKEFLQRVSESQKKLAIRLREGNEPQQNNEEEEEIGTKEAD